MFYVLRAELSKSMHGRGLFEQQFSEWPCIDSLCWADTALIDGTDGVMASTSVLCGSRLALLGLLAKSFYTGC